MTMLSRPVTNTELQWHLLVFVYSTINSKLIRPINQTHKTMNKFAGDDIDDVILNGITFRGGPKRENAPSDGKVRSKAKKKQYITGAHGSGSAKKKADIRKARANRHK